MASLIGCSDEGLKSSIVVLSGLETRLLYLSILLQWLHITCEGEIHSKGVNHMKYPFFKF